jgi:hypothetical protein
VIVEADDPTPAGERRVGRAEMIQEAGESFEAALEKIRPVAEAVIGKLQGLNTRPHEIGVEFGIKLGGKVDIWVAAAESEATFKVALKWKSEA